MLHSLRSGPDVPPPPKSLPFLLLSRQRYHRQISQDDSQYCQASAALSLVSLPDASISIVAAVSLHPVRPSRLCLRSAAAQRCSKPSSATRAASSLAPPTALSLSLRYPVFSLASRGCNSAHNTSNPQLPSPALSSSLRGLSSAALLLVACCMSRAHLVKHPALLPPRPASSSLCPAFSCHYTNHYQVAFFRPMEFSLHPQPLVTS